MPFGTEFPALADELATYDPDESAEVCKEKIAEARSATWAKHAPIRSV